MTSKITLNVTPSFLKALVEQETGELSDLFHKLEGKSTDGPLTHLDVKELLRGNNLIQKVEDQPPSDTPVDPTADTQIKSQQPSAADEEAARKALEQTTNEEMVKTQPGFVGKEPQQSFVGLEQGLAALKWAASKNMELSLNNVIWVLNRIQNNRYSDVAEIQRDLVKMSPASGTEQGTETEIYYSSIPGHEKEWTEPPLSSKEEPDREPTKTQVPSPPLSRQPDV